jgi:hypothetical protein
MNARAARAFSSKARPRPEENRMRRPFALIACTAALALAACSPDPPEQKAGDEETSTSVANASPSAPAGSEVGTAEAEGSRYTSAYTPFELEVCRVTGENPEGASVNYTCPGYADVPIFLHLGDGRFDLDAGLDGDEFMTIGAFNDIGERLEWRLHDGEPFAVIFRYLDVAPQGEGRTVLAVEKIGRAGSPGCRVAHVSGDTPDANRVAREIADGRTADFRCGADEMRVVGNAR